MTPEKKQKEVPRYKHKSIQKVYDLYQEHKGEMGKGFGMMSLLWKSIAPSIPELLLMVDEDEELLGKIKVFLGGIMGAMEEDGTRD